MRCRRVEVKADVVRAGRTTGLENKEVGAVDLTS